MKLTKNFSLKTLGDLGIVAIMACVYAATLHVFVFNSNFAPTGVDGIAVMLQYVTGLNAGYTGLFANIPLLFLAWFFLNRKYVLFGFVFVVVENIFILLFAHIGLFQYSDPTNSYILAAIFDGLIRGLCYATVLWLGVVPGGVDIVVLLIQKRLDHLDFYRILLVVNVLIISLSFFVYGKNLNPILLAVISAFMLSKVIEIVLKGSKSALEVKIITECPDESRQAILFELRHGVTAVQVKGGFTDTQKTMLFAVINRREIGTFRRILKRFDKTFAYFTDANDVIGNFRRRQNEEVK
jgi:uncharacterized membrane-anchored protein YitT (DUF2179 family)